MSPVADSLPYAEVIHRDNLVVTLRGTFGAAIVTVAAPMLIWRNRGWHRWAAPSSAGILTFISRKSWQANTWLEFSQSSDWAARIRYFLAFSRSPRFLRKTPASVPTRSPLF
jgi:hypothetical protein